MAFAIQWTGPIGPAFQGVAALARLDFDKHTHKLEALTMGEPRQRFSLRFDAEP